MAKAKKTAKAKSKSKTAKAAPKKAAKATSKKVAKPKKAATKKAAKPKKVKATKKVAKPKKVAAKKPVKEVKAKPQSKAAAKKEAKAKKSPEVELLDDDFNDDVAPVVDETSWEVDPDDVVLTDADGNPYCKAKDCDQLAAVDGYCRFHYILLWKRIQNRKKILAGDKLDRYIEELTARYPDKYLEMLRKDLASEKDFLAVVAELDIDEGLSDSEFDDDSENFIDEMRGVSREEGDDEF
ncbi:MAG: hypothetical protein KDD37_01350 [Bdellovibrionales bacterium]|nr:hypothetical protein [Bdellovibrionales bacterium]